MSSTADLYYVKLADGDVHRVSLDQLDDAFQAGHIDQSTMVLADGSDTWCTLGELAGIDDAVAPVQVIPQNEPRMPSTALPPYAAPPHAPAPYGQIQYAQPQQPRPAPAPQAPWQAPRAPQPPMAAPYAQQPAMRAPYGQTSAMPAPRVQPQAFVANSVRPVSVDLGNYDPDLKRARGGSGKRWLLALVALSVFGAAGGIAAVRPPWAQRYLTRAGLGAPSVAAAAAEPPPAPVEATPTPPQAVAPPPAPPQMAPPAANVASAGDSPLNPHFTDRFTPEQKEKLAEADKAKSKGRAKVSNPAASHNMSKSKSTGFTTGGNKFDPLNSSI